MNTISLFASNDYESSVIIVNQFLNHILFHNVAVVLSCFLNLSHTFTLDPLVGAPCSLCPLPAAGSSSLLPGWTG